MLGATRHSSDASDVQADPGEQRPSAAERVRQRPDQQLTERQADQRAGQRELDGRGRRPRGRRRSSEAPAGTCRSSAGRARSAQPRTRTSRSRAPPGRGDDGRRGGLQGHRHERPLRVVCIRQVLPGASRTEAGCVPAVRITTSTAIRPATGMGRGDGLPCRPCSSRGWRRSRPRSSRRCPRWPCAPGRSTSARASRTPTGPASLLADVAANVTGGVNQYPPGIGVPALRGGRRRAPEAVLRPRRRPRPRPGHDRGDRGDRRGRAGAVRAGRRGRHLPALLRLVRRDDRAVRARRCARSPLRPPGPSPSIPTSCAPRSPPAPAWCWSTPRTTRPARSSPASELTLIGELAAEFDAVVVTDEVYEHMIYRRRRRARPDGDPARAAPSAR